MDSLSNLTNAARKVGISAAELLDVNPDQKVSPRTIPVPLDLASSRIYSRESSPVKAKNASVQRPQRT